MHRATTETEGLPIGKKIIWSLAKIMAELNKDAGNKGRSFLMIGLINRKCGYRGHRRGVGLYPHLYNRIRAGLSRCLYSSDRWRRGAHRRQAHRRR